MRSQLAGYALAPAMAIQGDARASGPISDVQLIRLMSVYVYEEISFADSEFIYLMIEFMILH